MRVDSHLVGAALLTTALVTLAACSGSEDDPRSGQPSTAASDAADVSPAVASGGPWTAELVEAAGQPVAVGGDLVVVYETQDERLWLTAYDATGGEIAWTQEATPSLTTTGVATTPQLVGPEDDPLVAVLGRNTAAPLMADLLVLDAATGDVVREISGGYFRSVPQRCSDSDDVCVTAVDPQAGTSAPMRLDLADGTFAPEPIPAGWTPRTIATHGLVENGLRTRGRQALARIVDGEVLWERPVESAYGEGATTDTGWTFHHSDEADVFVGTVGIPYVEDAGSRNSDLARYRTVGLDGSTGEVLWTDEGSTLFCSPLDDDAGPVAAFVRCRATGTLRSSISDGAVSTTFHGLRSRLEGFDPATGRTTWSIDIGDDQTLYSREAAQPMASATDIVLSTARGRRVVDLTSGEVRAAHPGEAFLCTKEVRFRYADPVLMSGAEVFEHRGGSLAETCDESGAPLDGDLSSNLAGIVGAAAADHVVVATRHGLVGVR